MLANACAEDVGALVPQTLDDQGSKRSELGQCLTAFRTRVLGVEWTYVP